MLALFIIGAGIFVYVKFFKLTPVDKWDSAKSSPREDYIVTEKDGKMFVNNKKAGISFAIPEGWEVKENEFFQGIVFNSSDFKQQEGSYAVENGCRGAVVVEAINTNIRRIKEKLASEFNPTIIINEKYEEILLGKQEGIKHFFENNELYYYGIFIPSNNKLYQLGFESTVQSKDQCENQFNQFLETVSFN